LINALTPDQARSIASLAKSARAERDEFLREVAEQDLDGSKPGKGEHNPTAELGFEPLPQNMPPLAALCDAIDDLEDEGRFELFALVRIGQGDLAAQDWERGVADAEALGDAIVTGALIENADLDRHIAKGLYELKL
jgi:hypothetical protein